MCPLPVNMGAKVVEIVLPTGKSAKILKWKVKEGTVVSIGRVILLYDISCNNDKEEQKKLKATQVGTVRKLLAKEGEIVHPGDVLLELEECTHPTVMKDMCAECGADLRKEDGSVQNASIPMIHSIPDLKVSKEQALILGKADEQRLLRNRRLVLLVDLDQTLIHTTNDNIPPNLKDVYHFQLYGAGSPWYHTRLRPGTQKFLSEMSFYYELHICTFGARNYAHMIAMFLDQNGKFFSHRILSRDECFNPNSKTANLTSLFPCGDNLVCIIDDREDVWNFAPNLVHVKPYHFFQHTGDINAPPGLAKCENDDKEGFDFTRMEDSNENISVKGEVKENGDVKASGGKQKTVELESEREDGELSEDSRLGSGNSPTVSVKSKSLSKFDRDTGSNVRDVLEERTELACENSKQEANVVKELEQKDSAVHDRCRDVEDSVKQKVDDTNPDDRCRDIEGSGKNQKVDDTNPDDRCRDIEDSVKNQKVDDTNPDDRCRDIEGSGKNRKVDDTNPDDRCRDIEDSVKNQKVDDTNPDDRCRDIEGSGKNQKVDDTNPDDRCRDIEDSVKNQKVDDTNPDDRCRDIEDSVKNQKVDDTNPDDRCRDIEDSVKKQKVDDTNADDRCRDVENSVKNQKVDDTNPDDRGRDVENSVKKQKVDDTNPDDLKGDLELTDEEDAKARETKNCNTKETTVAKDGAVEVSSIDSRTKPPSGGNSVVVSEQGDAGGGESKVGGEDELVEVEDGDDYLLYLGEILKTVHKAFYELYDELDSEVPDLKSVIPYVRRKVLSGTSLVFSGLVPTHTPLEKSRAYLVARSLGAQVTQDLTSETTHLVAVRPGTAKVNAARRVARNVTIITPDWLWCCAERWEKVDERLFPLQRGGAANRHPPPHCGSPEHVPTHQQPAMRRRTPSGRFMDTINPLMSFSPEDIANMDREVEDIFNESESEGEQDKMVPKQEIVEKIPVLVAESADESSSSSADSLSGGEHPHGWGNTGPTKRKRLAAGTGTESDNEEEDEEDDMPSAKFRRGEALPSDLELGEDDDESFNGSEEPLDEIDDGDWNMMGAALEREFLSGNGE